MGVTVLRPAHIFGMWGVCTFASTHVSRKDICTFANSDKCVYRHMYVCMHAVCVSIDIKTCPMLLIPHTCLYTHVKCLCGYHCVSVCVSLTTSVTFLADSLTRPESLFLHGTDSGYSAKTLAYKILRVALIWEGSNRKQNFPPS